ncbi:MAG: DUF370 domain-containing protein [Oscillospiraceae bacterium]|jgi:hypothetical protein|nr:DUF370 domain-containing protein [Oscillospiraceae bacterium]
MYLHLGGDVIVPESDILAVLDIDNISVSKDSRAFLNAAQGNPGIITVGGDIPKAVVLCDNAVYLTQVSSATLINRKPL